MRHVAFLLALAPPLLPSPVHAQAAPATAALVEIPFAPPLETSWIEERRFARHPNGFIVDLATGPARSFHNSRKADMGGAKRIETLKVECLR